MLLRLWHARVVQGECHTCGCHMLVSFSARLHQGPSMAHSLTPAAEMEREFLLKPQGLFLYQTLYSNKRCWPRESSAHSPDPAYPTLMMQQKEGTREMHENSRVYSIVWTFHEPHMSLFHACAFCFNAVISLDLVLVILYCYYVWQKLGEKKYIKRTT